MNNFSTGKDAKELGATLLEMSMLLMVSGASAGRIRNTIDRISNGFGYITYILVSQRTIIISVYNQEGQCVFNSFKRTQPHVINFTIVSEISRISWEVIENKWTVHQLHEAVTKLASVRHYPRILVLALTALAGASFCRLLGGQPIDMAFVFLGTFTGLFIRQEAMKMRFNFYLCIYFAALTSSLITGALVHFDPAVDHEIALVTSILFLIPGIPLINAFSDMIEGNLQNGLIRGLNGFIISFTIALGLFTSIAIYRF